MEVKVDSLKDCINTLVITEMKKSPARLTRRTLNQRVVLSIAKELEVPLSYFIEPNAIYLHPHNLKRISELWTKIKRKTTRKDATVYERITSTDYLKYNDLCKFIKILVRRRTVRRNKMEKIQDLGPVTQILAMDGFSGFRNKDFKFYVQNLKVGDEVQCEEDWHVMAVRQMYDLLPPLLSGADAVCLVFLALLDFYRLHIAEDDDEALEIFDGAKNNVVDYLTEGKMNIHVKSIESLNQYYSVQFKDMDQKEMVSLKINEMRKKLVRDARGRKPKNFVLKNEIIVDDKIH